MPSIISSAWEWCKDTPPARFCGKLAKRIKSLDGIDEVATIAAQILPGLAGPATAFTFLTTGVPFVYMGAGGMTEEYQEACAEYDTLINDQQVTLEEIVAFSERWRQVVATKLQIILPPPTCPISPSTTPSLEEVAKLAQQFQQQRDAVLVQAYDKKYGHLGAIGMGGMLLGLLPASTAMGIGIADKVGTASSGAVVATSGLGIASGVTFGIGQAAMFGYAAAKRARGLTKEKQLYTARESFRTYAEEAIDANTVGEVLSIIDNDIYRNRKHSIAYGRNTMVGQAAMFSGTMLGLTGVGGPAGLACFAVGAPMTILPAISRIVHEEKEEKFHGDNEKDSDYVQIRCEKTSTSDKLKALERAFNTASDQLAYLKFLSLLHHAIQARGDKQARLEKMAATGNLSLVKGSGLKGDILTRVQQRVRNHHADITELLKKTPEEASAIIQANLLDSDDLTFALEKTTPDAMKREALITSLDIGKNCEGKEGIELTKKLLSRLKSAHKAIRYDLAQKLLSASQCLQLQEELKSPNEPVSSYNPIHPQLHHSCPHYRALHQALRSQPFAQQQQQLERYRQQVEPFTLASHYKNATGDTVYLWHHPCYPNDRDHSITYIVKHGTDALTVLYGDKVSAIVAADAGRDVGVKLVDIQAGRHSIHGDLNNHRIQAAMHHRDYQQSVHHRESWVTRYGSQHRQGYIALAS